MALRRMSVADHQGSEADIHIISVAPMAVQKEDTMIRLYGKYYLDANLSS